MNWGPRSCKTQQIGLKVKCNGHDTPAIKTTRLTAEDEARLRAALEARMGNMDVEFDGADDSTNSDSDE